jgi:hypothetical protein
MRLACMLKPTVPFSTREHKPQSICQPDLFGTPSRTPIWSVIHTPHLDDKAEVLLWFPVPLKVFASSFLLRTKPHSTNDHNSQVGDLLWKYLVFLLRERFACSQFFNVYLLPIICFRPMKKLQPHAKHSGYFILPGGR